MEQSSGSGHGIAGSAPTPSSEILHIISTFTDVLDSLPPHLSRSLSEMRELDAVLSGSLQSLGAKLEVLLGMMVTKPGDDNAPTPLQRLQILREVTEDAKVFRVGGEDKVRVATGTCETIATHTQHLSSLSTLLLSFLPPELLQTLPPPSAPHGYPSSSTPSSSFARRQAFDYPPVATSSSFPTSRLGMPQYDHHYHHSSRAAARAPTALKRRVQQPGIGQGQAVYHGGTDTEFNFNLVAPAAKPMGGGAGAGGNTGGGAHHQGSDRQPTQKELKEKDPNHRHPNQYTKKKQQLALATGAGSSAMGSGGGGESSVGSMAADSHQPSGTGGRGTSPVLGDNTGRSKRGGTESTSAPASGATSGGGRTGAYPGMASAQEYAAATGGAGRGGTQKRKIEDPVVGGKRRKTTRADQSPDPASRTLSTTGQAAMAAGKSSLRRTTSRLGDSPEEGIEDGADADDDADGDGATYCVCNQVSFGEMIGCDSDSCEREWFHLSCIGLSVIPKGRWLCDDCRPKNKRRGAL